MALLDTLKADVAKAKDVLAGAAANLIRDLTQVENALATAATIAGLSTGTSAGPLAVKAAGFATSAAAVVSALIVNLRKDVAVLDK